MSIITTEALNIPKDKSIQALAGREVGAFTPEIEITPNTHKAILALKATIKPGDLDEHGAILLKDEVVPTKKVGDPVEIDYLVLDDKQAGWIEGDQWMPFSDSANLPEVVFISNKTAQEHPNLVEKVRKSGVRLIFDQQPTIIGHTHPSGNMPSPGDVAHLFSSMKGVDGVEAKITNMVVTTKETFFLVPSKETPTTTQELSKKVEEQFREIISSLLKSSGGNSTDEGVVNGARYKLIQYVCLTYAAAMYVLQDGQSQARRIF